MTRWLTDLWLRGIVAGDATQDPAWPTLAAHIATRYNLTA